MKCLLYIAGDVTNYKPVRYIINQKEVHTFIAAHALSQVLNPDRVVALLPDSLIIEEGNSVNIDNLIKAYRDLLRKSASKLQNQLHEDEQKGLEEFIQKMEVRYVPNIGVGSAMLSRDGEVVVNKDGNNGSGVIKRAYKREGNPTFVFNVIYSVFKELESNGCDEFLVDITHGTNVLVSITLSVGSLFNSRFFSAPVIGNPGTQEVRVLDLTEVVEATKDSLMISSSIEKLDERYFKDYSSSLRGLNPNTFNRDEVEVIKNIKSADPNKVINLLRNIRNGFSVNALRDIEDVNKNIKSIKQHVDMLRSFFSEWYKHQTLDVKEIVISNFYSTFKVERITSNKGDDIASLKKLLKLYIDASMYDKAFSLARELPVAFCMKLRGGGTFDDEDDKYKECDDLVTSYFWLNHSEVLKYRNMLMHGGLSVDLKVNVSPDGKLSINKENQTNIRSLEEESKKLENYELEIMNEIEKGREGRNESKNK
jgi:CRISPR-associated protein Csx1